MPYYNGKPGRQSFGGKPPAGGRRGAGNPRPFTRGRKTGNRQQAQHIAHSKYINKAKPVQDEEPYESTHVFADFPFQKMLHENIAAKNYVTPSPIQDQAIPHILNGHDVIGLANTGTGKTAAFLLPIIHGLSPKSARPSVLIIAPTRELAQQIDDQFREFSRGMKLYSATLVGGVNIQKQLRELARRPHMIIGTPGRIKDLYTRGALQLGEISTLVLDEADRMLDMGFLPDIRRIIQEIPTDRQTLFFSATITPEITALTSQFLDQPVTVSVRTTETSDHVEQDIIEFTDKDDKYQKLEEMLLKEHYSKVLIFCGMKFGAQRLADRLNTTEIRAAAIHGNKSQSQRQRALDSFKAGKIDVLVATDVAARGIDVPNVTHVINFDAPATYDDYIHRIGRTGRGGARGHAHTFVEAKKRN